MADIEMTIEVVDNATPRLLDLILSVHRTPEQAAAEKARDAVIKLRRQLGSGPRSVTIWAYMSGWLAKETEREPIETVRAVRIGLEQGLAAPL